MCQCLVVHPLQVNPAVGFLALWRVSALSAACPRSDAANKTDITGQASKDWLPLANDADSIHTPTMSLKNAALLALVGTILLTVLVTAHFISTVLGVMHEIIPAMALLTSLIRLFASLWGCPLG